MEDKMSESDIFDEKRSVSLFSNEKLSTNLSMDIANSDCKDLLGYSLHCHLCCF